MTSGSDSDSEPDSLRYCPPNILHGDCESVERYEPGGFHPVHIGDVYDGRYRVVNKLHYGGFSTVWLARDTFGTEHRWVALKIVTADDSPTYEARCAIARAAERQPGAAGIERRFWIDGPNGRHLCLVLPALGPDLSRLSFFIYARFTPAFARQACLQVARTLAQLHANGLGHGDFTPSNMVLRLVDSFDSFDEGAVAKLFGPPRTAVLYTSSEGPPGPHGPDYVVGPMDFTTSATKVLDSEVCIIDFDQSFIIGGQLPIERPGVPAQYMAPEVAVGQPLTLASDVWALGCAIFRIRSGADLFFDYDTDDPYLALSEMIRAMGELPTEWKDTRFDADGWPVTDGGELQPKWEFTKFDESGNPMMDSGGYLELRAEPSTRPMADRVRAILDDPPGLFINGRGEVVDPPQEEPPLSRFGDGKTLRVPYPEALGSMLWKPTAVCVDGDYFVAYSGDGETDRMLEAFPKISDAEASLLIDLLSKIFTYDPTKRITAEEVVKHPWFHMDKSSGHWDVGDSFPEGDR